MESCDYNNNSLDGYCYDFVFIGGGPSTLSVLTFLLKHQILEKILNTLNILIIEKSNTFGSGCLGKYGINSNTSAEGFVRLISHGSEEEDKNSNEEALSPSKSKAKGENVATQSSIANNNNQNQADTSKTRKIKIIPCFKDLFNSKPAQLLINLAAKPAPLPLIGHFLDCTGNSLADYIYNTMGKNILMLNTEAISISFNKDEFFSNGDSNQNYNYEITVKKNSTSNSNNSINFLIKTKNLILASGAKQRFDQTANKEIFSYIPQSDFFHSDYVLQEQGYASLLNNLKNKKDKPKKVIIIGGSHSGFSCAWILLNGPADYSKNENNAYFSYKNKTNSKCSKCSKYFCCLGSTQDKNWKIKNSPSDIEINILYKDHIKVYYHSEKEALNDGYNCYDPAKSLNKNGNIYPFIGIRGDAKELYRKVFKGIERRVKLVKINSLSEQKDLFQSSSAVIWAAGYTSERIKIIDKTQREIELCDDANLQYEVDKECHLMFKDRTPIQSLIGIGQGYSTNSVEILSDGKNARADSVNLYNTYIAKKLVRAFDPVYFSKNKEKEKAQSEIMSYNNNNVPSLPLSNFNNNYVEEEKMTNNVRKQSSRKKIMICENKILINSNDKNNNINLLKKENDTVSSITAKSPNKNKNNKETPIKTISKQILYKNNVLAKSIDFLAIKDKTTVRSQIENYKYPLNPLVKSSAEPVIKNSLQVMNKTKENISNMKKFEIINKIPTTKEKGLSISPPLIRKNNEFDIYIPHPMTLGNMPKNTIISSNIKNVKISINPIDTPNNIKNAKCSIEIPNNIKLGNIPNSVKNLTNKREASVIQKIAINNSNVIQLIPSGYYSPNLALTKNNLVDKKKFAANKLFISDASHDNYKVSPRKIVDKKFK